MQQFFGDLEPIEQGDVAQIKQLARHWALAVHKNLWPPHCGARDVIRQNGKVIPRNENFAWYLDSRWLNYDLRNLMHRLEGHGYVYNNRLTQSAFNLLLEPGPFDIFVSYKRSESSAFALLVNDKLKSHSLLPFVDMALEAGSNWHADLEQRIKACDFFVILLGHETLASDMTAKEICWAIDAKKTIIPVWHNGFGTEDDFDLSRSIVQLAANWNDQNLVSRISDVRDIIQRTNAIRVTDESASGYNSAIVELLNRFGITP